MAQGKIIKAVRFLEQQLIKNGISVSNVFLFGSQSRNNASDQSDIDIMVVSDDFKNKNIFQRAILTKQAEISTIKKFMLPLDIITLTVDEARKKNNLFKFAIGKL